MVTLNMARLGGVSRCEENLLGHVDRLMELARDSLETKRKVLEHLTRSDLYPYSTSYLRATWKRFGAYWHHHFSTIGLVGMNEACLHFLKKDIGTAEGQALATRVLDHMRTRLSEFQEQTGNVYNLEATPAEGASYRLARLDRQEFPHRETATADAETPYYTNSTQLPVGYSDDIYEVLEKQARLSRRSRMRRGCNAPANKGSLTGRNTLVY